MAELPSAFLRDRRSSVRRAGPGRRAGPPRRARGPAGRGGRQGQPVRLHVRLRRLVGARADGGGDLPARTGRALPAVPGGRARLPAGGRRRGIRVRLVPGRRRRSRASRARGDERVDRQALRPGRVRSRAGHDAAPAPGLTATAGTFRAGHARAIVRKCSGRRLCRVRGNARRRRHAMLLRLRVRLPDRPGSLGQVARTLGVTGADIVQMVVLERVGGRAVDDFTVIWPAVAPVDRILAGLAAIPGVTVEGVWRSVGAPAVNGADAELVGQVAANPSDGIATLVDAIPGLLSADWAAVLTVAADWARPGDEHVHTAPAVVCASWQAPHPLHAPDVTPLRPRYFDGGERYRYATAPFGRAGLVLLAARGGEAGSPQAPAFHVTEAGRLAQLVRASAPVLGSRLHHAPGPGPPIGWPINRAARFAAIDT